MADVGQAARRTDIYAPADLHQFAQMVFEKLGMTAADATIMAGHLVWAELHGVAWLGMRKVLQYARRLREGGTPSRSTPVAVLDMPSLLVVDGRDSWAQVTGHHVMKSVIAKARSAGVCIGLVRNTTTAGVLGYYANLAVDERMIGLAINNAPPLQAAAGGIDKVIGNQAFAVASPAGHHPPLVLDMALSAITLARIHEYQQRGEQLPEGLALDATGAPTVDPVAALVGVLLPMAGHRGFGLAVMWEILTGVLSGSRQFSSSVLMPDVYDRPQGVSLLLMAINPELVMPYAEFQARVDQLIDGVRAGRTAPGIGRATLPGERSQRLALERRQAGIPISATLADALKTFAAEVDVTWPRRLAQ